MTRRSGNKKAMKETRDLSGGEATVALEVQQAHRGAAKVPPEGLGDTELIEVGTSVALADEEGLARQQAEQ